MVVKGDKGETMCSCTASHIFLQLLSVGIQGILHVLEVKVVTNCKMSLNNTAAFHVACSLTFANVGSCQVEICIILNHSRGVKTFIRCLL